jgi:hypothetical protein
MPSAFSCGMLILGLAASPTPDGPAPIPDPPRQADPWTPPPGGPPGAVASAARRLFDLGLADPRGCVYRAVTIRLDGTVVSGEMVIRTHAWTFPDDPDAPEHFAIGPDGLIYPAEIGEPADLKADVEAGLRDLGKPPDPNGPYVPPQERALGAEQVTPLRAALLLRAGEAELARRAWGATGGTLPGDPFPALARAWALGLHERTRSAHLRGDDRLALDGARRLGKALPTLRAFAADPGPDGREHPLGPVDPWDELLRGLPRLLADQERRAREPRVAYDPDAPPAERVATLIDLLDEIAVRQMSVPGGVNLGESGVVRALIDEGEPAIDPLLDELGRPDRLTRSAEASRMAGLTMPILPTSEAVAEALATLLSRAGVDGMPGSRAVAVMGPDARRALADSIRRSWHAVMGTPPAERWYRDLADGARADRWAAAAGNIVAAVDPDAARRAKSGDTIARRGDPLRDGREPSVSALMARRADELARREDFNGAAGLALQLVAWDPEAARPVLAEQMERVRLASLQRAAGQPDGFDWDLSQTFLALARKRIALGDEDEALDAYAEWLVTVPPRSNRGRTVSFFALAWTHPDHPEVAGAVEAMFDRPNSPWLPLVELRPGELLDPLDELLASPLIGVAGFRKALVRALVDDTLLGTVRLDEQGIMRYDLKNGLQGTSGGLVSDPDTPAAVPPTEIRARDYVAWKLAAHPGLPPCMPYWPEERKAEVIKEQIRILERYGERFADATRALDPERSTSIFDKIGPAFPPLDRPATAEDVESGRAIFSLAGEGREARVVPLPSVPLEVRWTGLERFAIRQERFSGDGRREPIITYLQEGQVWQAEEVLEGGAWKRYVGFVGPLMARAPAEEIGLIVDGFRWHRWTDALDLQLTWPTPPEGRRAFGAGDPVVVALAVRNRTGLDRPAPTELVRRLDDGTLALRGGLRLTLERSDAAPLPGGLPFSGESRRSPEPEPIPARSDARFEPAGDEPARTLGLAESFEAARFDVRDLFPIDRPGQYRLHLWIDGVDGPADGPAASAGFRVERQGAGDGRAGGPR